jgi:hypothetical protein
MFEKKKILFFLNIRKYEKIKKREPIRKKEKIIFLKFLKGKILDSLILNLPLFSILYFITIH